MASFDRATAAFLILAASSSSACGGVPSDEGGDSAELATTQEELRLGKSKMGCAAPRCARTERLTDLGVLDAGAMRPSSQAQALNNAGTVVGVSSVAVSPVLFAMHAFRWTRK